MLSVNGGFYPRFTEPSRFRQRLRKLRYYEYNSQRFKDLRHLCTLIFISTKVYARIVSPNRDVFHWKPLAVDVESKCALSETPEEGRWL